MSDTDNASGYQCDVLSALEEIHAEGFAVLPSLLSRHQVALLCDFFRTVESYYFGARFQSTFSVAEKEHRILVNAQLACLCAQAVGHFSKLFRLFFAGFAVKHSSGNHSILGLHRDISMVPYDSFPPGLTMWIPLDSVGPSNGCIEVLRGSHRWSKGPRVSGLHTIEVSEIGLLETPYESVPMSAGDALIFDCRTLHQSGANRSERARVAVMLMFAPRSVPVVWYRFVEAPHGMGDWVEEYAVPDDYYVVHGVTDARSDQRRLRTIPP
jgi:hypothetical protein